MRLSSKRNRGRSESAPASAGVGADVAFVVNGWRVLFHQQLIEQIERLFAAARTERGKRGPADTAGPNMKLAAALWHQMLREIPEDPSRPKYRQGGTLGDEHTHWLRTKFGSGRYRLFFRYHTGARVIVFAWVNDAETLRTYGSRTDAYAVFRGMLESGNPPGEWDALVGAASAPDVIARAKKLLGLPPTSDPQL